MIKNFHIRSLLEKRGQLLDRFLSNNPSSSVRVKDLKIGKRRNQRVQIDSFWPNLCLQTNFVPVFALFHCFIGLIRSFQVFLGLFSENCEKSLREPI